MSPIEIKICGITRVEDALAAVELGAEMLGLNFYPASPRCITLQQAQQIAAAVAGVRDRSGGSLSAHDKSRNIQLVGVFVNMNVSEVLRIARAVPLDAVQLHGDESPAECEALAAEFPVIRALKVDKEFTEALAAEFASCNGLLLDAPGTGHGGSGKSFGWAAIQWQSVRGAAPASKLILAGGLHPGNVAEAIAIVHPDAVDVCSGVESAKGIKSFEKLSKFVAAVRSAERQEQ